MSSQLATEGKRRRANPEEVAQQNQQKCATYANRRGKPVSYTQANESTTSNENEPRRSALNNEHEARGKATARQPRGRSSTEAAEMRHAQTSSEPVSYTQAAEATTNNENDNENEPARRTAFALIIKPARESDGARTLRKRLNRSSVEVRRAQTSSEPVSYTQAAEAMTNNDNDNEPRRTAYLIMKPARESDGAPTPRKKLNGSSRSAIYANRAASPSRTHTPIKSFKQINGRQRQAQNARAEHMKRACDGSPRESDQGLTTSMPWPCSGCMQRKRQ